MTDNRTHNLKAADSYDAQILTAMDGRVIAWNLGAQMLFGYTPEEAVGKLIQDLILRPSQGEEAHMLLKKVAEHGSLEYEGVRYNKDGKAMRVSVAGRTVMAEANKPAFVIADVKSIASESCHSQSHLVEYRYDQLMPRKLQASILLDQAGLIVQMNNHAESLFGYRREDLIGKPFEFLVPTGYRASHAGALKEGKVGPAYLTKALSESVNLFGITMSGERIPLDLSLTQMSVGQSLMTLVTLHELSAGEQLESMRALLASIVASSDDAIISMTPDELIMSWNRGAEKMFGYTAMEMIGHDISRLRAPEFIDEEKSLVKKLINGETVNHYDTVNICQDGSRIDVSVTLSLIKDVTGNLLGISKTARNITERKRLEAVLHEKQVLEDANRTKDRFLATMSHELRTPLNAIIGFTGTLLMKLPGPLNERQEKQLKIVQGSAKQLLSLINDLLDLAKIEAGKVELLLEDVNCQDVLEEVVAVIRPASEKKDLALRVIMPSEKIVVRADRRSVYQILLNLANNAVKFTEHGSVTFSLSVAVIDSDNQVQFRVVDTGIGITPAEQARLFSAFTQVGPISRRREDGTGLGLYLSQRLAQLISGRISFESTPGLGSSFTLSLIKGA